MEGERSWAFTAPAFTGAPAPAAPATGATYLPAGWKKRRRNGRKHRGGAKRHKELPAAAASAAACATVAPLAGGFATLPPPNPAQLAPLRCSWPHPAVLELLAQQCWPAAGPAALLQHAVGAASASWQVDSHPEWWNRMLPSLSLLYPPLPAQQLQELLAARNASSSSSYNGGMSRGSSTGSGSDATVVRVQALPQPNVLVGYQGDWLEVAPEVLPLWMSAPLAPFAGPKALLHYLVCPTQQLPAAEQLVKDVGSLYETCNLGSHMPASSEAVHAFKLPPAAGACGAAAAGSAGGGHAGKQPQQHAQQPQQGEPQQQAAQQQREQEQQQLASRYLVGLRGACEQLQRQLLLDPPPELQQLQGSCLEDGAEPAVLVYVACPLEQPSHRVAALLEAASCLAPCTPLGTAADAGALGLLPHSYSGFDLATGSTQQQASLAPSEPQQPDRPATATPAADTSRAPGGSPPPDEPTEAGLPEQQQQQQEQQGQQGQQQQQQRYHGAAQVLHDEQRGDFRQLPVRRVQRSEGSQPINIVLQLLSPEALTDISGTAARCLAFALYSKARHVPSDNQGGTEPLAASPVLPFCSQPLMVLASAADEARGREQQQQQQQVLPPLPAEPAPPFSSEPGEQQQPQQEDGECIEDDHQQQQQQEQQAEVPGSEPDGPQPALPPRTLHCCYLQPPPGCSLLPLAVTDSCGELLHAELLDTSAGSIIGLGMGMDMAGSSSDSLVDAALAAGGSSSSSSSLGRACHLVLRRCLELLGTLRSASTPSGLLHSVAIAGLGMQAGERDAWRRLIEREAALELPAGAELSVLDVEALPPARYAGPEPPSGCQLVLLRSGDGTGELQASISWLPAVDGTSCLLPREHDVVRTLHALLVCRCSSEERGPGSAQPDQQQPNNQQGQQQQPQLCREEHSLCELAGELHGLAWLHAAFQGACLRTVGRGGQAADADAHLPLHAALASQLHSLLVEASTCLPTS